MVWAILVTIIICLAMFAVISMYNEKVSAEERIDALRKDNRELRLRAAEHRKNEIEHMRDEYYRKGLRDGSKCDSLYQSILQKYSSQDQVKAMMYGNIDELGGDANEE